MEALASVAQWTESGLRTKGSRVQFPVRDMPLVVGLSPPGRGRVSCERQPHIDVSLLFLPSPLSKIN